MIRAALDLGARCADVALWDGQHLHLSKRPLPDQSVSQTLDAADAALAQAGASLADVGELRLSQTWALNALLARKGAPVTLVVTRGFGDILLLARQDRADLYEPVARSDAPTFLVGTIVEVDERMDAEGRPVNAPDPAPLAGIGHGPVAVCLLNAHMNGAHERAVANALPGRALALSHRVDPQPREYERCVATCLEAWLIGALAGTLATFREGLAARGFAGKLLMADGTGTLSHAPPLSQMLTSGPALAARASASFDFDGPAIAADLGSQSLDLSLSISGRVVTVGHSRPGGVPLRQVVTDTVSLPIGGCSRPVPGGPTVDAALAGLGRLHGETCAEADPTRARQTVEALATSVAYQIVTFAVARNLDPCTVSLVIMGGLGAIVATDIADALERARVHLAPAPAQAGALSLLSAPETLRLRHPIGLSLASLESDAVAKAIAALRGQSRPGFAERWTAGIATVAQTEPERVPLSTALGSPLDLDSQWREHMHLQTGVRPTFGHLAWLELTLLRKPDAVPPPPLAPGAPAGWTSHPTSNGGVLLERSA